MIKLFEEHNVCKIVLYAPLVDGDIKRVEMLLLDEKYESWIIEFGSIYNIDSSLLVLLHTEKNKKNKKILIITHKSKLNRYLHNLGFNARFISPIKDSVVKTENIEVVLIGGSADSSQKIIDTVSDISISNISIVVVQHVKSVRVGMFDKILQEHSNHKVYYAEDGKKIKKNRIYLAPNNKHLKVKDAHFFLSDEDEYNFSRPSISISYESFSAYYKESLLVIQECGYAKDGVDKLKFLKSNNSTLIIQNSDECKAKSMVTEAIALGVHDYLFIEKDIIDYINFINMQNTKEKYLDYMLEMINQRYHYDFRSYHRDMIERRLDAFIIKNGIKNIKDAVGVIVFNKIAFEEFFLSVSINVTELFRDPLSFRSIAEFLNEKYSKTCNIKLWSAGCSSGEEVYSMAILLERLGLLNISIVYATDFNKAILEDAKNGVYSKETCELGLSNYNEVGLDDELSNYVINHDKFVIIKNYIREKVNFFQHNLVIDGSFNEFDIIICKNVLIYFDDNLQQVVFQLFYDSLKFGGYLVLGKSEMVHVSFADKFQRYKDDSKIFKKVA